MAFEERAAAAEAAVEAKLASVGAGEIRQQRFEDAPAAAETATPDAPTVEDTAPVAPPADTTPVESPGDPAVATVLNKYGNDPVKVAQAYAHLQAKLAEQANELGQLRQGTSEYQALLGEFEQLKQTIAQTQAPQYQVPDAGTMDWVEQQIIENPHMAARFAQQASQSGQPWLHERVMRTWHTVDPYAASQYQTQTAVEQARREWQAQQPAYAPDEGQQMQTALASVLNQHPEFNQYADSLTGVINRYPAVAQGLTGGLQEKQATIEALFALAERDTLRALALTGATPAEPQTQASVVTPTTSESREEPAPVSPLDAWRSEFRQEAERYTKGALYTAH